MKSGSMADFFYHAGPSEPTAPKRRGGRLLTGGIVALLVLSAVAVVGGLVLGSGTGAGAGVALVGGICFVLCLAFLLLLDFRAAYREGADDWDRVTGGSPLGDVRDDSAPRAAGEAWVDRAERTPDTHRLVLIALDAVDAPYPVAGEVPASYPDERRIGLGRMVRGGTRGPEFDVEAQGRGRVTQWAEIPRLRATAVRVTAAGGAGKQDGDYRYPLPTTGDDHD